MKISTRDLLWLTLVAFLTLGWAIDHDHLTWTIEENESSSKFVIDELAHQSKGLMDERKAMAEHISRSRAAER